VLVTHAPDVGDAAVAAWAGRRSTLRVRAGDN